MPGHIKLGTSVAGLADYILTDPRARVQELANPYAAKVGMGAGKFDDLTTWSAWVMDNWEAGIGREKAADGGLAYSNLDSRVPNQLILRPAMGRVAAIHGSATNGEQQFMPADATTFGHVIIGAGQTYDTFLVRVKTGTGTRRSVDLHVSLNATSIGATITYEPMTWSDNAGAPNAKVSSGAATSVTATADHMYPKFQWLNAASTYASFANATYYWVGFRVTAGTMTVTVGTANAASSTVTSPNGAAPWTGSTDAIFQLCEDLESAPAYQPTRRPAWMGHTSGTKTYAVTLEYGTLVCREFSNTNNNFTTKAIHGATDVLGSSHCASWCGSIYIPVADTGVTYARYAEDGVAFTTYGAVSGIATAFQGFTAGQGYLWGWEGNEVYYSNVDTVTASDWTGPIEVGPTQFPIKSMCAFGDYMYVATQEALWYIGYGDVPIHVLTFPTYATETGVSMVQHMGALYVTVGGRVWQYSATGQVMDVWFPYTGDTSVQRGDVVSLCSTGNNLYAVALPDTGATSDHQWYVYSWNGQGWHTVMAAQSPYGTSGSVTSPLNPAGVLYYGRQWNKLFLIAGLTNFYWARIPDSFINPFRDTAQKFSRTGYCTTPWFDGELIDVSKDYESVFLTGENLSSTKPVDVYWQDDASTSWELLGRASAIGQELRWSSATTRPSTKRFRLMLIFYTTDPTSTPQVTGVRVKYRANVTDRWRWTLPILVSANQQFPDGSINPQTPAQMRTALNALAKQVPPVFFQDVDGVQYEVWVTGCRRQIVEYEYYNSAHQFMEQYLLTLEQVQSGTVN